MQITGLHPRAQGMRLLIPSELFLADTGPICAWLFNNFTFSSPTTTQSLSLFIIQLASPVDMFSKI
jgi:hypothetical protein